LEIINVSLRFKAYNKVIMSDTLSLHPPDAARESGADMPNSNEIIQDATQAAERIVLGEDDRPRRITTPLERELIKDGAKSARHEQALLAQNESLTNESMVVPRTGLSTEKVLRSDIVKYISLAMRENAGVMLLEVDGSGLKAVNDEHGTAIGDNYIMALAKGIQNRPRQHDRVYRRRDGSDEFWVLIPFIRLREGKIDEVIEVLKDGVAATVAKEIDADPELAKSPVRNLMGVSVGAGWVNFADHDPRHEVMSNQDIADKLFSMAAEDRILEKKHQINARNQARLEAGEAIPEDERLQ
jgi:diguanylate cyclase (GGDEF)-like protein